jgi:hypothetical protein
MVFALTQLGLWNFPGDTDVTLEGILKSTPKISKETPDETSDFLLSLWIECATFLFLSPLDWARGLTRGVFLMALRVCEEVFTAESWRTRNALFLLEKSEVVQEPGGFGNDTFGISEHGYLLCEDGTSDRILWSEPGIRPRPPTGPLNLLADEKSKILVRCDKWTQVASMLPVGIKDNVVYNPAIDSGWPQTWTFIACDPLKDGLQIPLSIAGAPVIVPAPKRYPAVWSNIPPPKILMHQSTLRALSSWTPSAKSSSNINLLKASSSFLTTASKSS